MSAFAISFSLAEKYKLVKSFIHVLFAIVILLPFLLLIFFKLNIVQNILDLFFG